MFDLEKKHQKEIDKVEASYAKAARQGWNSEAGLYKSI